MIAALYVETNGVYFNLPNVDPWDEPRDARRYNGPWSVIAHPPCSRWCQLAYINQKRYGHKVGDDGGMFRAALAAVHRYGGVLEHPARSYAWPAFGLPKPPPLGGGWAQVNITTHVCEVAQVAYGHPARKLTWLYYVGPPPFDLNWSSPAPTHQVSFCGNHGNSALPRIIKKAAARTPIAFRDELIRLAEHSAQPLQGERRRRRG